MLSVGTYQATGTTNAAGQVTIIVPPLALTWTDQYIVIARATNFDYVKTAASPDPLYSAYPVLMVAANTTRNVPLALLATFKARSSRVDRPSSSGRTSTSSSPSTWTGPKTRSSTRS